MNRLHKAGFRNSQGIFVAPPLDAKDHFISDGRDVDTAIQDIGIEIGDAKADLRDIQSIIGYASSDIYGLEVDFTNRVYRRLAGAVGRLPGGGFNDINIFSGRRRCIVADNGTILAFWGDAAYTETGALTVAVTVGSVTFPVGTSAMVMVYQPRFYYRVVPVALEAVAGGRGYHLRHARYYISETPRAGFKLHPAFIRQGREREFVLIGAYEGSLQQNGIFNLTDEQTANFAVGSGDRLASRAGAKPASGLTQQLNRRNCGILAENRGPGWSQLYAAIASATQMLMMIEFGTFNTQNAIGRGVVDFPTGTGNESLNTGATAALGNSSGMAPGIDGQVSVSYRGQENPWGNIWECVDGMNFPANGSNEVFIADHNFIENRFVDNYVNAGISISRRNGYISAFCYSEPFDWLFLPSETWGDSELPVGDHLWQNWAAVDQRVAYLGALWSHGSLAGGFCWRLTDAVSHRGRSVGGRLVYVP